MVPIMWKFPKPWFLRGCSILGEGISCTHVPFLILKTKRYIFLRMCILYLSDVFSLMFIVSTKLGYMFPFLVGLYPLISPFCRMLPSLFNLRYSGVHPFNLDKLYECTHLNSSASLGELPPILSAI